MIRRNTIQRALVLDAVRQLKCHAAADEVYAYIVKSNPNVGKATVYRNLNLLAEDGLIKKIETSDGPDRYDHITSKHHHVRCEKCGRYFDIEMKKIPNLISLVEEAEIMNIEDFDITFKGICSECKEKE